jgi:hypothetical protein
MSPLILRVNCKIYPDIQRKQKRTQEMCRVNTLKHYLRCGANFLRIESVA